jgi:hypothetical protein
MRRPLKPNFLLQWLDPNDLVSVPFLLFQVDWLWGTGLTFIECTKFGRDLVVQAQEEHQLIPLVVQCCVDAVDHRGEYPPPTVYFFFYWSFPLGLDFEGIYRKSGGAGQMRMIQQNLEAEEDARPDLCDSTLYPDICAITSILKQYFRDLPNPLFPYECYDRLMDSVGKER